MKTALALTTEKVNNYYDIMISGINKINIINSDEVEILLTPIINESRRQVQLNFKNIDSVDWTGFITLLEIQKKAYINNVKLLAYNVNNEILFRIERHFISKSNFNEVVSLFSELSCS